MSFFSRFRRFGNAFSSNQFRDFRLPDHGGSGQPLIQQFIQQALTPLWNEIQHGQALNELYHGWSQRMQLQYQWNNQQQLWNSVQQQTQQAELWNLYGQSVQPQLEENYDHERSRYESRRRATTRQPLFELYKNQFKINKKSHAINSRKSKSHISSNKRQKQQRALSKKIESFQIKNFNSDEKPEPEAERSQVNYLFLNSLLEPHHCGSGNISYERLYPDDPEYFEVDDLITNRKNFIVDAIFKLDNPLLSQAYELKKKQKKLDFSHTDELRLFHGTTWINAENICRSNFNWRKCKTHLYGKGVSFSKNCNYAANYCDETTQDKVMILAKVLVSKSCVGDKHMVLPPDGYDTSQKSNNEIVVVKYEDNEFLPLYKIYFHLIHENIRFSH